MPGGHGTVMRVTLRSRRLIAGYLSLWIGGVLLVNLIVLFSGITGATSIAALPFTLIPLALLVGTVAGGRLLARTDGPALVNFIRQTTNAQDLAPELRPSF
jgi:hypothetical protein